MKIRDILSMPTVYDNVHESVYRSYHILHYVEDLLRRGTPGGVVLELLDEIKEMAEAEKDTYQINISGTPPTDKQIAQTLKRHSARANDRVRTGN